MNMDYQKHQRKFLISLDDYEYESIKNIERPFITVSTKWLGSAGLISAGLEQSDDGGFHVKIKLNFDSVVVRRNGSDMCMEFAVYDSKVAGIGFDGEPLLNVFLGNQINRAEDRMEESQKNGIKDNFNEK